MGSIYLINITGQNQPGLLEALCSSLQEQPVELLDVSQAVIHASLALSLILHFPDPQQSKPVLKELLYQAHDLSLDLEFSCIGPEEYQNWSKQTEGKTYILTLLGRSLNTEHLFRISSLVRQNQLDIAQIDRLSDRRPLTQEHEDQGLTCIEMELNGNPGDLGRMRSEFLALSRLYPVDIGLQEDTPYRRHRRLIAFDMDSTLIQSEVIDELAFQAGAGPQVQEITSKAMQGELDFKQSLQKRVSLLQGLDCSVLEQVARGLTLTQGAQRLIQNLKILGYKIAIISGGFTYFGRYLQDMLEIDYLFANELEIEQGKLTGKIQGEVVDGQKKAELLQHLASQEDISLEQVIAVGDGANDLPMLNLAGLGIAFHAKPMVRQGAKQAISNVGLDAVLYFLGLKDKEAIV
ncbi:MAG: phosphoserine phosphatase SerB [Desulfohalobiaceae bacterium]